VLRFVFEIVPWSLEWSRRFEFDVVAGSSVGDVSDGGAGFVVAR
jgi:hypothetical protein